MKGYVIAGVTVEDPAKYEEYRSQVMPTVLKHGGRFVVRGGTQEVVEGSWNPKRIVVLEFPSYQAAKDWYHSPEYQPLAKLRASASQSNLIIVEGAP